jgi:phosphoribosylformylglycinamidine synthase
VDEETLDRMEKQGQIVLRYCDTGGNAIPAANPNGSLENIAGIINEEGNVFGLMPHPERACDPVLRHTDGQKIFRSIIATLLNPSEATVQLSINNGGR